MGSHWKLGGRMSLWLGILAGASKIDKSVKKFIFGSYSGKLYSINALKEINRIRGVNAEAPINDILYTTSAIYAASNNGLLYKSTNQTIWTTQTSNISTNITSLQTSKRLLAGSVWRQTSNFSSSIAQVAFGNGVWVAGGGTGTISVSTDTVTWTTQNINFASTSLNTIGYGNGLWIAAGGGGVIRTSTNNAVTWSTTGPSVGSSSFYDMAFGGGRFIITSGSSFAPTTTNGTTWTNTSIFDVSEGFVYGIGYGNGQWVAVGTQGARASLNPSASSWFSISTQLGSTGLCVAYGNGLWVVGGASGKISTASSQDLTTWTSRSANFTSDVVSISYGNGLWVAASSSGQIRTSTDGIVWVSRISNLSSISSIANNGSGQWVATTTSSSETIKTSVEYPPVLLLGGQ